MCIVQLLVASEPLGLTITHSSTGSEVDVWRCVCRLAHHEGYTHCCHHRRALHVPGTGPVWRRWPRYDPPLAASREATTLVRFRGSMQASAVLSMLLLDFMTYADLGLCKNELLQLPVCGFAQHIRTLRQQQ